MFNFNDIFLLTKDWFFNRYDTVSIKEIFRLMKITIISTRISYCIVFKGRRIKSNLY